MNQLMGYINMVDAFSDIFFDELPHKYTDSYNTNYTSVTTFIGKLEQEKDWNLIAEKALKKPENAGKTVEGLRAEWKAKGDYACTLGTMVHSVMELGWQNKEFYPDQKLFEQWQEPDMKSDFIYRKGRCKHILKTLKERYIPIKNEFIVYDRDWKLCGTIDFLAYNKEKDCISILDWKTNKKWDYSNRYQRLQAPFDDLEDCNIKHYELQLSTYKAILEKHTGLEVGEMLLVHIPNDSAPTNPAVHKCKDYSERVSSYLNKINNISE